MKSSFKNFTPLTEGQDYGITHVEDLDVEAFIRAIDKIHDLHVVQKLDGANLRMGLNEKGALYTSREQKGGKRFYDQKDFPDSSAYDGFRAAHEVVKKVEPEIKTILSPGEAVNMEVIYGDQPNTVFYGKDGYNYLAFLEMLPGDDPSRDLDQSKVKKLNALLRGKSFTVKTIASDTTDGELISRAPRLTDWKLTVSDTVSKEELKELSFEQELNELKMFLKKQNPIAKELGRELTNFEVMKDRSPKLSEEKERLQEKIFNDYKLPIKKKLLDLVNKQKPSLRGEIDDDGAYDGIEGLIFTDPVTREKFKVVDRDVFTAVNKFNYQVRNGVAGRITSNDPEQPIEVRGGLVGEARLRSVKLFGLDNAELPTQTKKVLAKFQGDSHEETVQNIVDSLNQLKFEAVKRKICSIYATSIDDLEETLLTFKQNADTYEMELPGGKKIKYTKEIRRRTLMSFAEAKRTLLRVMVEVKRTTDMFELVEVMFKKQLESLHGGDNVDA